MSKNSGAQEKQLKVKKSSAGLGLFTLEDIKKGSYILDYTGELITQEEADRRGGRYLFEINSKWTIDGKGRENKARYINHSCDPNCETDIVGRRVKISAIKNIKAGEELTYDYGEEYFDEFLKPMGCRCAYCKKR